MVTGVKTLDKRDFFVIKFRVYLGKQTTLLWKYHQIDGLYS